MFFFCKQKTAYEMRISDWSSDVCSSDLLEHRQALVGDQRAVDDRADTGLVRIVFDTGVEAKQAVDFILIQDAGGTTVATSIAFGPGRSEERRVGKECVRTCRSR